MKNRGFLIIDLNSEMTYDETEQAVEELLDGMDHVFPQFKYCRFNDLEKAVEFLNNNNKEE